MKRIVLALTLLTAACATPTVTKVETVEAKVPVAIKPLVPAQVPVPPAPLGPRPPQLQSAADLLLSKVCELEAYVLRADPLLRLSAGMPQEALPKYGECER